jgi:hypothetical protein
MTMATVDDLVSESPAEEPEHEPQDVGRNRNAVWRESAAA